jgi:hypothetical protein
MHPRQDHPTLWLDFLWEGYSGWRSSSHPVRGTEMPQFTSPPLSSPKLPRPAQRQSTLAQDYMNKSLRQIDFVLPRTDPFTRLHILAFTPSCSRQGGLATPGTFPRALDSVWGVHNLHLRLKKREKVVSPTKMGDTLTLPPESEVKFYCSVVFIYCSVVLFIVVMLYMLVVMFCIQCRVCSEVL